MITVSKHYGLFLLLISLLPLTAIAQPITLENAFWEYSVDPKQAEQLVLSADKQTLWVGSNLGIEQRNANTGKLVRVLSNFSKVTDQRILALTGDQHNGIWIGTAHHLMHLGRDEHEVTVINTAPLTTPETGFQLLADDGHNGLWVGTQTQGIAQFKQDSQSWHLLNSDNSILPANTISGLVKTGHGGLWLLTTNSGIHFSFVYRSFQGEWKVVDSSYTRTFGPPNLAGDNYDGVWIGTPMENDYSLTPQHLRHGHLQHLNSLGEWRDYESNAIIAAGTDPPIAYNPDSPYVSIHGLSRDDKGGLWFVGIPTLVYLNPLEEWQHFHHSNITFSSMISAHDHFKLPVVSDGDQGVWSLPLS